MNRKSIVQTRVRQVKMLVSKKKKKSLSEAVLVCIWVKQHSTALSAKACHRLLLHISCGHKFT